MKYSQKSLPGKVLKFIGTNNLILPDDKIIVAVSGGADSVCLFDVLCKLRDQLKIDLLVCHYNHRLRGEDSYNDFEFVQKLCLDRGVELIYGSAEAENLFKSEDEARVARYAFFEKILGEGRGDKIATAHNANDMVETFLLRLIRGSGISGLKSIPHLRQKFIRPLLTIPRSEIETYLKENNLQFRLDKTNEDLQFTRNFVRCEVIPLLKKINPSIISTLTRSISVIEQDYDLLSQLTIEAFKQILLERNTKEIILDRKKYLTLHSSLQLGSLRHAISELVTLEDITIMQLDEVTKIIQKGESKKYKLLPHSLRVNLDSGKIILSVK